MKKIIAITLSLILIGVQVSYAAAPDDQLAEIKQDLEPLIEMLSLKIENSAIRDCKKILSPIFDAETLLFLQFIDTHYKNKSLNSSLNNIAIAKYGEYRLKMSSYIYLLTPKAKDGENAILLSEEFNAYKECDSLANAYVMLSKEKMIEHIRQSTYQKKATAFVEKYESINDQMRDLNYKFAKMYSYFATFKNKLPGFLTSCITK